MRGMSEPEKVPPFQSSRLPTWPRLSALFTTNRITAAFTVVLALATLALVVTAIFQHNDAVEAIEATKRLALATETAASDHRRTASAEFVLKFDARLDEHRYDKITDDIQSHDRKYILPKYPDKTDADVEEYISIFDDIGYLVMENLLEANMAYNYFSYDIEKTWCNVSVKETIQQARTTDRSKTAHSDPLYGNFEKLAKEYLDNEGQTCEDLDSAPAVAGAQKTRKRP